MINGRAKLGIDGQNFADKHERLIMNVCTVLHCQSSKGLFFHFI